MEKIEKQQFESLIDGAKVISSDNRGDKVFRLRDGQILKLFRVKRILSSSLFLPYAVRFARGGQKLQERKIPTVTVTAVYRVKGLRRDAVVYRPLEGVSLREALAAEDHDPYLLGWFGEFLAGLHDHGVYFRAIHFGNVIVHPAGGFGLIDLVEVHARNSPLSLQKRLRNIKHAARYPEDHQAILDFGAEAFVDAYLQNTDLSYKARRLLIGRLSR